MRKNLLGLVWGVILMATGPEPAPASLPCPIRYPPEPVSFVPETQAGGISNLEGKPVH